MLKTYTFGITPLLTVDEIESKTTLSVGDIMSALLCREEEIFYTSKAWMLLGKFLMVQDHSEDAYFYSVKVDYDKGIVSLTEIDGYPKVTFPSHTVETEFQGIDFMENGIEIDL